MVLYAVTLAICLIYLVCSLTVSVFVWIFSQVFVLCLIKWHGKRYDQEMKKKLRVLVSITMGNLLQKLSRIQVIFLSKL